MNPRPPINYQVSQSQLVTTEFLEIVALAKSQGRRALVLRAARYIVEELAYDPLHFGESRAFLSQLELELRIGFAPPLYVDFAVHEKSKHVYIRRFGLCG